MARSPPPPLALDVQEAVRAPLSPFVGHEAGYTEVQKSSVQVLHDVTQAVPITGGFGGQNVPIQQAH